MILYQLQCADGHQFEAWFRDSATYDTQAKAGDIECPMCGGHKVSKALMTPNVPRKGADTRAAARAEAVQDAQQTRLSKAAEAAADSAAETLAGGEGEAAEARATEVARQILRAVEKIRDHVETNYDYVGDKFADEARAIRYGDSEERGIYGEATEEESEELAEEGIEFQRLPRLPKRN